MRETVRDRLAAEIPHLRRFARSLEHDPAAADDLVQSCLERALRKGRLWRPTGSLRSWLFRILYRQFLTAKRSPWERSESVSVDATHPALSVEAGQADRMHCLDVLAALDTLPDDQRAALSLVSSQEFTYEEAAHILSVPEGTLRSRIARGRATLRRLTTSDIAAAPHLRRVK